MSVDLTVLKNELETDPEGLGYGNSPSTDGSDAALLNDPALGGLIRRPNVDASEIKAAVDAVEFDDLSPKSTEYVTWVANGAVDARPDAIFDGLTGRFPAGGPTRTALLDVLQRQGSRGEVLFGAGVRVTASDVANARRL